MEYLEELEGATVIATRPWWQRHPGIVLVLLIGVVFVMRR